MQKIIKYCIRCISQDGGRAPAFEDMSIANVIFYEILCWAPCA